MARERDERKYNRSKLYRINLKIGMNRSILDVEPPKVYIISCAVKGEC